MDFNVGPNELFILYENDDDMDAGELYHHILGHICLTWLRLGGDQWKNGAQNTGFTFTDGATLYFAFLM